MVRRDLEEARGVAEPSVDWLHVINGCIGFLFIGEWPFASSTLELRVAGGKGRSQKQTSAALIQEL